MTRSEFSSPRPYRSLHLRDDHGDTINSNVASTNQTYASNKCAIQAMNIDEPRNNLHNDDDSQKHTSLTVISSWHEICDENRTRAR